MADREDNVYMAKLAEQAERYDGKCFDQKESIRLKLFLLNRNVEFNEECCCNGC